MSENPPASTRVDTSFGRIEEMHPNRPERSRDTRPARVLASVHFGAGLLHAWQGAAVEYDIAAVGQDRLLVDALETRNLADGLWVGDVRVVRSGVSDYDGRAEYETEVVWRPATEEEWASVIAGEDVWEPAPAEPPATALELLDDVEGVLMQAQRNLAESRRLVRASEQQLADVRRAERSLERQGNGG